MCRDDADREILLPFEQKGIFYQISERCGKPNHNVMQISDIVARNIPPRIIKLVFGRFPVTPCSFTGLMKVDTARLESSIIASTIINTRNILIEIPLTANMRFKIVKLTDELKTNQCYKNAMNLCHERATTYMRNIKVCYNFSHKADENLQMIKKESDMDLISSDEGNDELLSSGEIKTQSKKSSSLKRRFRKTKSLERNNNTVGEKEMKSSLKRGGSKKNQSTQSPYNISDPSTNGTISGADMRDGVHTRFSHEIESENTSFIRPGRSFSTGRMSFCFGNSYLTVPVFATELSTLDEDKNNSNENLDELVTDSPNNGVKEEFPPAMPCTNIGSYVNTGDGALDALTVDNIQNRRASEVIFNETFGQYVSTLNKDDDNVEGRYEEIPPNVCTKAASGSDATTTRKESGETTTGDETDQVQAESDADDYIPVSPQRRPSSKPPDFAPPPLPPHDSPANARNSISTSSDASGGVNDESLLSRLSAEQIQYDIPKIQEPDYTHGNLSVGDTSHQKVRRPSTFTFTEGLNTLPDNCTASMPLINELREVGEHIGDVITQKVRRPSTFTFTEGLGTLPSSDTASMPLINEFGGIEEDSPVYENIQALQELMLTMENLEIDDSDLINIPHKNEMKESPQDSFESVMDTDFQDDGWGKTEKGRPEEHENERIVEGDVTGDDNIHTNRAMSVRENFDETIDLFLDENQALLENDRKLTKSTSLESSSSKISKQNSITERQKSISELTVDEFIAQLEQIGIRDNSLNRVKELEIDGKFLSSIAHDDESLKECLPDVSLIDLQKIAMFLRGWRPHEES